MKSTYNLGESLREILSNRNLNVKQFAQDVEISLSTAYSWLSNTTEPNISALIRVADYLHCTIEFLIGRSDDERDCVGSDYPPLAPHIKKMIREAGISTYALRNDTRFEGSYFYNWEHGSSPLLSTLVALADRIDCTVDDLIGRT